MIHSIKMEKPSAICNLRDTEKTEGSLFIFAVGYEERSTSIFQKYIKNTCINTLCFLFDDFNKYKTAKKNKSIIDEAKITPVIVGYNSGQDVIDNIIKRVEELQEKDLKLSIHIDYSSMPRSWYCTIPVELRNKLRPVDKAYFWYTEGEYVKRAEEWPSAGIDEVHVFSGRASLRPINNRCHVLGLGFDSLRSQAILSVVDPSFLVVSCSYPSNNEVLREVILNKNQNIINSAAYSIELPIDNFEFSISKLYETVKELFGNGDVILVPDGPKPLILATSLLPFIMNRAGIICLHIKRHQEHFGPLNVKPKDGVFGFSFYL